MDQTYGNFIFDTGSDAVLLNTSSAKSDKKEHFNTLQGEVASTETKIERLTIGLLTKRNIQAFTANLSNIEQYLSLDIAGIIGTKIFNPDNIYIDFETKLIHLIENDDQKFGPFLFQSSFEMDLGVPTIEVMLDQKKYRFILDSGATTHLIDDEILKNHAALFSPIDEVIQLETLETSREVKNSKYKTNHFSLNGHSLISATCISSDFSSLNIENPKPIHGILSLSKITQKSLLIDFKKQLIRYN